MSVLNENQIINDVDDENQLSLEGIALEEFINSTLPTNLSIDYHSNTRLQESEANQVLTQLTNISEYPRCQNHCCIFGTCETYNQNVILFPCCGYNHCACSNCLKQYFTTTGLTCPMCRSNIIENPPLLQPKQKLNLLFGLSPNDNNDENELLDNKKHIDIGYYVGHKMILKTKDIKIAFKSSSNCIKIMIPKNNQNQMIRSDWIFYKNMNLQTQQNIMDLVSWYQDNYSKKLFYSENILWNLVSKRTHYFKEISILLKAECFNTIYINLYHYFYICVHNFCKKHVKCRSNINGDTSIDLNHKLENIILLKNKERKNFLLILISRNNNYIDEIQYIKENTLSFYNTCLKEVNDLLYKFVGWFSCQIYDNNLNCYKNVWDKVSNTCSSMAQIHQFILNYLNLHDLNNLQNLDNRSQLNALEEHYKNLLIPVYKLFFKHLKIYCKKYTKTNYSIPDYKIKNSIKLLQKKERFIYNYWIIDNKHNLRKISLPVLDLNDGYFISNENRLNNIDILIAEFKIWLYTQLYSISIIPNYSNQNNNNNYINDIWHIVELELHNFSSVQNYMKNMSYNTMSSLLKNIFDKLKKKVVLFINNKINTKRTNTLPYFNNIEIN